MKRKTPGIMNNLRKLSWRNNRFDRNRRTPILDKEERASVSCGASKAEIDTLEVLKADLIDEM
jgi:hypothetical protein